MENKHFKKLIEENIKKIGFQKLKTAFFKESDDTLVFLVPRKSGYSNLYYLRLKVELKPIEYNFVFSEYIRHDVADILMSIDTDMRELFDLENDLVDSERIEKMEEFFKGKVDTLVSIMLSKEKIINLSQNDDLFILPNTKTKLGLL